jgi:hypothetical protein
VTTLKLIETLACRTDTGKCLMCRWSIDDCNRYSLQCLGHVARAARSAGTGAVDQLEAQFVELLELARQYP